MYTYQTLWNIPSVLKGLIYMYLDGAPQIAYYKHSRHLIVISNGQRKPLFSRKLHVVYFRILSPTHFSIKFDTVKSG